EGIKVESSAPAIFTAKAGESLKDQKFDYTLTNTTSNLLEYKAEILWPENEHLEDRPVVVTANESTSAVAGELQPGESKAITIAPRSENGGRGWQYKWATDLYGWYTGMAYLLPIIGGYIADRFIGTHRSMVVGGLIIALGHIVLAASGIGSLAHSTLGMTVFVFGLVLIVLGTGHFKPCVSVMVGQLYPPGDPRREGGFSIFYMGINLGAFICAFVCGTLGEKVGWHWGFGSAAVGMIAGLLIYTLGRPNYLAGIGLPPEGRTNTAPMFAMLSIVLAAGVAGLYHVGTLGWLNSRIDACFGNIYFVVAFLLAIVMLVGWFVAAQKPGERGPVFSIFVFILFNVLFWMAFEQAGSSLNIFAEENTNRYILGREMPTTWFQSVNAFCIIMLAPLFNIMWSWLGRRNMDPSQSMKISMGLFLLGVGYLFMVWAGVLTKEGAKVGSFFLLATYFFHTLGELCLSPTGLSYVTKTAPLRFMSLLMGVWFLSSFVAGVAGGKMAGLVEDLEKGRTQLPWHSWNLGGKADFFLLFVVTSFAGAAVMLVLVPLMKRVAPEKA
ncbi:MAG TPA: peptide MFS transporter, partial [Phycisphaerales bacterium]|nr:peptide MFS transporter [Phycisphaerales bacterium]